MIPPQPQNDQRAPLWQHELRLAFNRPADLLAYLELDPATAGLGLEALRDFPLRVPRGFAARMRKGDPLDPLFLQVWPSLRERDASPGYVVDAVGDLGTAIGRASCWEREWQYGLISVVDRTLKKQQKQTNR